MNIMPIEPYPFARPYIDEIQRLFKKANGATTYHLLKTFSLDNYGKLKKCDDSWNLTGEISYGIRANQNGEIEMLTEDRPPMVIIWYSEYCSKIIDHLKLLDEKYQSEFNVSR